MKTILQLIIGGAIGFSFIYVAAFAGIEWSLTSLGFVILTLVLSFPIHILLHELGHVIFGLSQGMRLMNISVGPFVIERYKNRIHFHFSPAVLAYAGRAMMFFPEHEPKEVIKRKLIPYLYGGIIINILTGAIALLVGLFVFEHYVLAMFGMIGLFIGFSNWIPQYSKAVSTDGFAIKQLRSEKAENSIMVNTYSLLIESEVKSSPAEWSKELINDFTHVVETNDNDPRTKALIQLLSYYYLPDDPDVIIRTGKRFAFMERGKQPDLLQDSADIFYIAALFYKGELFNNEKAKEALVNIGKLDRITYHKKLAFIHILEGDEKQAVLELENALQLLAKWNSLYMRGGNEKQHIRGLIERLKTGNLHNEVEHTN